MTRIGSDLRPAPAGKIDPITVEVIRGFLETVADEMSLTMKRTAVTPIFSESSDYSCAVMDGHARLIAQALRTASLPVHMGAMKFSVQAVLQDFEGRHPRRRRLPHQRPLPTGARTSPT